MNIPERRAAYRQKMAQFAAEKALKLDKFKQAVEFEIGIQALAVSIEWEEAHFPGDVCELKLCADRSGALVRIAARDIERDGFAQYVAQRLIGGLYSPAMQARRRG